MSLKRKFQYVYTISSAVIAAALVLGILLSKNTAHNEMGVEFIYPDITLFKDKVKNMQQDMIQKNPSIVDIYNHIQEVNKRIGEEK